MGKWEDFEQHRARRAMRHHGSLTENASGCRCGLKWQPAEYVELVKMYCTARGKLNLSDYVDHFDRPAGGISAALNRLGITVWGLDYRGVRCTIPKEVSSKKMLEKMPPGVVEILVIAGWEDIGWGYFAPEWHRKLKRIHSGRLNKFNREL